MQRRDLVARLVRVCPAFTPAAKGEGKGRVEGTRKPK